MGKSLGILYTELREDEQALITAARRRGIEPVLINTNDLVFNSGDCSLSGLPTAVDVVIERAIDHFVALYCILLLERAGIKVVNSYAVAQVCGDKLLTTLALCDNAVPTPLTKAAFSLESALDTTELMGHPVMLKPLTGDKGRLVARLNDYDATKAVLEYKTDMRRYDYSVHYLQEYIQNRPGRDIRVFVVGHRVIKALYLLNNKITSSQDRNPVVANCPITPEIEQIALAAAQAVGGGVLAVDLIEDGDNLKVIEVDYTIEMSCVKHAGLLAPYIIEYALSQ
jgi:[lysine-biosynthesis-protein LysW]---L-2-aminoadipate ligase